MSQLGLLGLLPVKVRSQIYSRLRPLNDDSSIIHLSAFPSTAEFQPLSALCAAHPALAVDFHHDSLRKAHQPEPVLTFHAGHLHAWSPAPHWAHVPLGHIRRLDIEVQHCSPAADVEPAACMAALKMLRSNISRCLDFFLLQQQQQHHHHHQKCAAGLVAIGIVWDREFWCLCHGEDGSSKLFSGRRYFLPDEDEAYEPFINYVLAPLKRLDVGRDETKADGGVEEEGEGEEEEESRCLASMYTLPRVYLDLKVLLRIKE